MKLEPNMYVRTLNGIVKIDKIQNDVMKDTKGCLHYGDFIKASHNIIDLIEVGDVLIDKEGHKYPINYEFETDYNNEYGSYEITIDDNITLFFKDDLSIVTKQQFSSMEYKL